jgi:hypothetical protein
VFAIHCYQANPAATDSVHASAAAVLESNRGCTKIWVFLIAVLIHCCSVQE